MGYRLNPLALTLDQRSELWNSINIDLVAVSKYFRWERSGKPLFISSICCLVIITTVMGETASIGLNLD